MNYERIILNNASVEISECAEDPNAYVGKFIICDFKPNKNGAQLDRDTITLWMDTLKNQPLVGKIATNWSGKEDFTSHNVKKVIRRDDYGNEYEDCEFDTSAFGTFINVGIEYIDGTEHLVAYAKIWKRFKKACELIKTRSALGTLATSWEISVIRQRIANLLGNVVRVIEEGSFLGHCLLGANYEAAYDSSRLLNVAAKTVENDLQTALLSDINEISKEEDETLAEETKVQEEQNLPESEIETKGDPEAVEAEKVSANEDESTSEPTPEVETEPKEDQKEAIESVHAQLAERDAAIVALDAKIQALQSEIVNLSSYKERFEQDEKDRIEQETAAKKNALRNRLIDSKTMSVTEIESSDAVKAMIDNLDEAAVNKIISDKIISEVAETIKHPETAQKSAPTSQATIIDSDADAEIGNISTPRDFIKSYLRR